MIKLKLVITWVQSQGCTGEIWSEPVGPSCLLILQSDAAFCWSIVNLLYRWRSVSLAKVSTFFMSFGFHVQSRWLGRLLFLKAICGVLIKESEYVSVAKQECFGCNISYRYCFCLITKMLTIAHKHCLFICHKHMMYLVTLFNIVEHQYQNNPKHVMLYLRFIQNENIKPFFSYIDDLPMMHK